MTGDEVPVSYWTIVNWTAYQHYRDRQPPWVKLHVKMLDNAEIAALPTAAQLLAYKLLMVAARTDNRIPDDARTLAGWCRMDARTVHRCCNLLASVRYIERIRETRMQTEMAKTGQMRLTDASAVLADAEDSASTRARGRVGGETEAEQEDLPSTATSNELPASAPADDKPALPGGPEPLERLIDACGARGTTSEGVIRAIAAKMPEHVHARALESFLGRTPRPDEPIAYAIGCLKSIAADTGRQTPRIDPTKPPEPPDDF